jgi:hypothetical protein
MVPDWSLHSIAAELLPPSPAGRVLLVSAAAPDSRDHSKLSASAANQQVGSALHPTPAVTPALTSSFWPWLLAERIRVVVVTIVDWFLALLRGLSAFRAEESFSRLALRQVVDSSAA